MDEARSAIEHSVDLTLASRETPDIWVAYSGGRDSHVLLHVLSQWSRRQSINLRAIHINHGLQVTADSWEEHCTYVCHALEIPLQIERVQVSTSSQGVEAAARDARYRVFAKLLDPGDTLLMAHHLDDQVETLLLRLFRGSGVRGLGAMRLRRKLGRGWLMRPLLALPQAVLVRYAEEARLRWVDDPTNEDIRLDRNYLRHGLLPKIRERWPGVYEAIGRTARLSAQTAEQIEQQTDIDLMLLRLGRGAISISTLLSLNEIRGQEVLRAWIEDQGGEPPAQAHIREILSQLSLSRDDAQVQIGWKKTVVRRYRDALFILSKTDTTEPWQAPVLWSLEGTLMLGGGSLIPCSRIGEGIARRWRSGSIIVQRRAGGERIRIQGRGTKRLKALFQEHGIPPWERQEWPLVYVDDELAAVPGLCVAEKFLADDGEPGNWLVWEPASAVAFR